MRSGWMIGVVTGLSLASFGYAIAAPVSATVDKTFVGKVSQGGMYEVESSKLAERKAQAQDVKDFANAEVHDHTLVGDKLKAISAKANIAIDGKLNPDFSGKLSHLNTLSGHAFDVAYMQSMSEIHAKDGAAFAKEAATSANSEYKAFAAETHTIVQRHIGAIHGATPPMK